MSDKMIINKESSKRGLYFKLLIKLFNFWNTKPSLSKKDYLELKEVNLITSRLFCIDKKETFEILKVLQEFGFLSFKKYGKIILNYEVAENGN